MKANQRVDTMLIFTIKNAVLLALIQVGVIVLIVLLLIVWGTAVRPFFEVCFFHIGG